MSETERTQPMSTIKHMQKPMDEHEIRKGALPNASREDVLGSKHTGGGCVDPKCGC